MKKVLAWAVALALVLSSFTMAFAADTKTSADFKDASSINYNEAVDVMVAQEIINGYPDGTFGPQKTVKRSEMAKMIAVMMNGGEDIGDTYKGACPFKDSQKHWAAGYIAYCASEHIIDGRSADVFDPEATVTGTEVAKMALTSLGYDSKIQGYTGENWAAAVLKDAKKNDLFDGLMSSFVPGNPCDRESAAQILFNCLQASKVEYDNSTSVKVGDAEVTVNSKVKPVTEKDKDGKDVEVPLYKDVFDNDLVKTPATTDEGKPAHKWANNKGKDEIGTYPDEADETTVVEEASKLDEVMDDLAEKSTANNVTINGFEQKNVDAKTVDVLVGDKVEMFETDTDNVYNVVIMRYELAKITEVDTNVTEKDAKDDITAYVYINGDKINDTNVANFDADTYVEDTYIAAAFQYKSADAKATGKDAKILDSYVAKSDQGKLEKKTKSAITVNGKSHDANENYSKKDAGVNTSTESVAFGSLLVDKDTYDVYFDANDYVIGAVVSDAEEDIIGVLTDAANGDKSWNSDKTSKQVKILDQNAKENVYSVTSKVESKVPENINPESAILIKYELNDNDKVKTIVTKEDKDKDFGELTKDTEVTKRGIMGSVILSEDVVAFYYDAPEKDAQGVQKDEDEVGEWITYDYNDLLEAKVAKDTTYVLNSDGEVAFILLKKDIADNSANNVLGFYVTAESYSDKDGAKYDVTVLVNGSEETYTTAKDATVTKVKTILDAGDATTVTPIKLVLDKDGNAKEITTVEFQATTGDPDGDWADTNDAYVFGATVPTTNPVIADVSGKNIKYADSDFIYVGDATVLRVKYDDKAKFDSLVKYSGKMTKDGAAILIQFNEDSDAWDTVVYITKADLESL